LNASSVCLTSGCRARENALLPESLLHEATSREQHPLDEGSRKKKTNKKTKKKPVLL
jgi:hypothetical protein